MRRAVPLSLALLTGFVCAAPAVGRQAPEGELPRLQAEYRDEAVRARRLRADAEAARTELAQLERRLTGLRVDQTRDDRQIEEQRARLRQLSEREAELVTGLARERGAQARLLSALQMMSRRPPPPLLVPADKAIDTVRAGPKHHEDLPMEAAADDTGGMDIGDPQVSILEALTAHPSAEQELADDKR